MGNSETNTKIIDLYYFPKIIYNIVIDNHNYHDLFDCYIENNKLYVTRTDAHSGWGQMLKIEIIIKEAVSFIYLKNIVTEKTLSLKKYV